MRVERRGGKEHGGVWSAELHLMGGGVELELTIKFGYVYFYDLMHLRKLPGQPSLIVADIHFLNFIYIYINRLLFPPMNLFSG